MLLFTTFHKNLQFKTKNESYKKGVNVAVFVRGIQYINLSIVL